MVKNYNKYSVSALWFLIILLISLLFSPTVLAISTPEKNDEINSLKFERQSAIDHILYRLQIIDITTKNISKINLNRLEYSTEGSEGEINLIKREELLEILGSEFELELENIYEQEKKELILGPRILVAPGYSASMYVAQEELFLDTEYTELESYINTFELEVSPWSGFDEENKLFTTVNIRTGEGTTGLETEVLIKAYQPQLLAVMESSKKVKTKKLGGKISAQKKRYFAIYLSARPVGILTLPDISTSLSGLGKVFNESEILKNEGGIILKSVSNKNSDKNYELSLAGFYQNQLKWRTDFTVNELLTGRHLISVTGHIHDDLWLGLELILLEEDETELALKLKDRVFSGPFNFSAGINPVSYNFDNDNNSIDWHFRGETTLSNKFKLALEYKGLSEYDLATVDFAYDINDFSLLLGYTWNLDIDEEKGYWLGIKYNF